MSDLVFFLASNISCIYLYHLLLSNLLQQDQLMLRMEQNNNEIASIAGNQATILDLLNGGQMESNAEVVPSTSSTDDTQEVEVKVESNDER